MLAAYLLQAIERHADKLAEALIRDLTTNPPTPSFRRLPVDALWQRAHDIYGHLADWLAGRDDADVEATFDALGRQRFSEQIPLEELVYALILTQQHLRERISSLGEAESAIELHYQIDLQAMLGRFFDRALYATVKGYEAARRAPPAPERREAWARFGIQTSGNLGAWMP